jgi:hypothetical protein
MADLPAEKPPRLPRAAREALTALARATEQPLAGTTVEELAAAYADTGWRADAAVLDLLAAVKRPADVDAAHAAILSLYRPWLEAGALALQRLVSARRWPPTWPATLPSTPEPGTCLLFSDGLRFDLGRRLAAALAASTHCSIGWRLAALPTVTATAKPAVAPVADVLATGPGFEPAIATSAERVTVDVLRRLLSERGYQILRKNELGDPAGSAWTECGGVDLYLHQQGCEVAHRVAREIRRLKTRIEALLRHGWAKVVVLTDHGWLLLPGGLPLAELPEHVAAVRKGRCARLKPGATTPYPVVPWHWDPRVQIALAPGISCFQPGVEGEHGGLSPQEYVTPILTVIRRTASPAS